MFECDDSLAVFCDGFERDVVRFAIVLTLK